MGHPHGLPHMGHPPQTPLLEDTTVGPSFNNCQDLAFLRIQAIPTCKKSIDSQAEDDPAPLTNHFAGGHTVLIWIDPVKLLYTWLVGFLLESVGIGVRATQGDGGSL